MQKDINQGFDSESKPKITTKVSQPQTDSAKGFVTYLITGNDELGTFQIRRRYNDFFYLREALHKKWPAIYIPPIPQKKLTGNKDQHNIETRRRFFDFFLKRLAEIEHLFMCPITQQFLRNKTLDMEKFYQSLTSTKNTELICNYRKVYPQAVSFQNAKTLQAKEIISNFGAYLKRAQKQLKGLQSQVQGIVQARNAFTEHLNHCNNMMFPEYEKNIYLEYLPDEQKKEPNLLFVNNHKVQDSMRNLRDVSNVNSFDEYLDLLTYESLEVQAMEEALAAKDNLQNQKKKLDQKLLEDQSSLAKLNGGKFSLKSFFSKGSSNEQIAAFQRQIPELQKEINALGEFLGVVNVALGFNVIPDFKSKKQRQYYRMMGNLSQNELKYLASYGEFMKSIMEGLDK